MMEEQELENYFTQLSQAELQQKMAEAQHIIGQFQKGTLAEEVGKGVDIYSTTLLTRSVASDLQLQADESVVSIGKTEDLITQAETFMEANPATKEKLDGYLGGMTSSESSESQGETSQSEDSDGILDNAKDWSEHELKECIPCEFRKINLNDLNLSVNILSQMTQWLDDLTQLWKDLESLFNQDFPFDLCDLFDGLSGNCIPDLAKILALLSLMQLKLLEKIDLSWGSGFSLLIGPLLSPILSQLNIKLDQYIKLVLEPLECVIDAIDDQLAKLDLKEAGLERTLQKKRELTKKKAALKREKLFVDRKIRNIREEIRYIKLGQSGDRDDAKQAQLYADQVGVNVTSKSSLDTYGEKNKYSEASSFYETERLNSRKRTLARSLTNSEAQQKNINKQIGEETTSYGEDSFDSLAGTLGDLSESAGIGTSREFIDQTKKDLKRFENTLLELSGGISEGIGMVKAFLEQMENELNSIFEGFSMATNDKTYLIQELAKIARWVAIVNGIIKAISNKDLLCSGSNGSVSGFSEALMEMSARGQDTIAAQEMVDSDGISQGLLLASRDTSLLVNSFNELAFDNAEDSLSVSLEDATKTTIYDDLNDNAEMNKRGIIPKIEVNEDTDIQTLSKDSSGNVVSGQDYHVYVSDFCSKSAHKIGSSDSVKQWMVTHGEQ